LSCCASRIKIRSFFLIPKRREWKLPTTSTTHHPRCSTKICARSFSDSFCACTTSSSAFSIIYFKLLCTSSHRPLCTSRFLFWRSADPKKFQKNSPPRACMPARGFLVGILSFFSETW
jgi:hypothetical protein